MNQKLVAIAVDDEPKALEVIRLHTAKVPFLDLKKTFRNPMQAITWMQAHPVDLIFLDINMPHLSGLKFREHISRETMIIFTTAYSEYALESYDLNALDYLLKPIPFNRFLKAVLKAQEQWQLRHDHDLPNKGEGGNNNPASYHSQQYIYVKSGTKLHKIDAADILFVEKDGNYVFFHTSKSKIISRLNMTQLKELLPKKEFTRVHKSYIVAIRHIDFVENQQIGIAGRKVPLAKAYKKDLMALF